MPSLSDALKQHHSLQKLRQIALAALEGEDSHAHGAATGGREREGLMIPLAHARQRRLQTGAEAACALVPRRKAPCPQAQALPQQRLRARAHMKDIPCPAQQDGGLSAELECVSDPSGPGALKEGRKSFAGPSSGARRPLMG